MILAVTISCIIVAILSMAGMVYIIASFRVKRLRPASLKIVYIIPVIQVIYILILSAIFQCGLFSTTNSDIVSITFLSIFLSIAIILASVFTSEGLSYDSSTLFSLLAYVLCTGAFGLAIYGISNGQVEYIITNGFGCSIYTICNLFAVYLMWIYIQTILGIKSPIARTFSCIMGITMLAFIFFILFNPWTRFYFFMDAAGYYHAGLFVTIQPIYFWIIIAVMFACVVFMKYDLTEKIVLIVACSVICLINAYSGLKYITPEANAAFTVGLVFCYVGISVRRTREYALQKNDIELAGVIQQNMLTKSFPSDDRVDTYALMIPAKQIAGDFYDTFMLDKNHMCMVIADVSGKGTAAALFMSRAKALIHEYAINEYRPHEIFARVNNALVEDNPEKIFVSAFMCKIHLETGYLEYVNAGHMAPVIRKNGEFKYLEDMPTGLVLGLRKNIKYKHCDMQGEKDDVILLYTDGVTEACNAQFEEFGEDRLLTFVKQYPDLSSKDLVSKLTQAVMDFEGNDSRFDDITISCTRVKDLYSVHEDSEEQI